MIILIETKKTLRKVHYPFMILKISLYWNTEKLSFKRSYTRKPTADITLNGERLSAFLWDQGQRNFLTFLTWHITGNSRHYNKTKKNEFSLERRNKIAFLYVQYDSLLYKIPRNLQKRKAPRLKNWIQ